MIILIIVVDVVPSVSVMENVAVPKIVDAISNAVETNLQLHQNMDLPIMDLPIMDRLIMDLPIMVRLIMVIIIPEFVKKSIYFQFEVFKMTMTGFGKCFFDKKIQSISLSRTA